MAGNQLLIQDICLKSRLSLLLLLSVLNGVQIGVLVGLESFHSVALLSVMDGVLGLLFAATGAWVFGLGGGVAGYVCGSALLLVFSQIVVTYECRHLNIPISYRETSTEWAMLWHFGLPSLLVLASTQPLSWGTRVILANLPDGYAQLGLLNAAFTWSSVLLFIPRQISRPAMPILSNLHGKNLADQVSPMLGVSFLLTQGTAILIGFTIAMMSPIIMRSYGESFAAGTRTMIIMVIAHVISAGTLTFRDAIASSGRMWTQVWHSLIWGLVLMGATVVFADLGALGISYAFLMAYVALWGVQLVYLFMIGLLDFKSLMRRFS